MHITTFRPRGPKFRAQELGSHRTVAGAARCNRQILGSNPVQGGLEEKWHPFRCLKVAGLRFACPERSVGNLGPSGYEFESENRGLGPSGGDSKDGLAICGGQETCLVYFDPF